jgi:serine/threonine-protein kinase
MSGQASRERDADLRLSAAGRLPAVREVFGYMVTARLGMGARSVIYAVIEPGTRRKYALKRVLRTEPALDDPCIEQVRVEYEVSRHFEHPRLRKSHRLLIRRKWMFFGIEEVGLLMDLVEGRSLVDKNDYTFSMLMEIFHQAAEGLAALHKTGYLHADMKPHNIIVGPDRKVTLVDFGQSCKIGTAKTRIQGTPDYIAPEQIDKATLDVRTDVYNFGATMYWALTGRNIPTRLQALLNTKAVVAGRPGAVPNPSEFNKAVPGPLDALVLQCIRDDRRERPLDMNEVTARLQPVLADALAAEVKPLPPGQIVNLGLEDSLAGQDLDDSAPGP